MNQKELMTELRTIKAALKDKPDQKESAPSESMTLVEIDCSIVESLSVLLNFHAVQEGTNSRVVELDQELVKLHERVAEIDKELEKYRELSAAKNGGNLTRSAGG